VLANHVYKDNAMKASRTIKAEQGVEVAVKAIENKFSLVSH
jgi:hypothetical protein